MNILSYLIKFLLCHTLLFLYYKGFLEKEKINFFKRYYLIFSIVFSLLAPLISFPVYKDTPALKSVITSAEPLVTFLYNPVIESENIDSDFSWSLWPWVWIIYFIGVIIFAIRYGISLQKILKPIIQKKIVNRDDFS